MFAQAAIPKVAVRAVAGFAAVVFALMVTVENATAYARAVDLIVSEWMAS